VRVRGIFPEGTTGPIDFFGVGFGSIARLAILTLGCPQYRESAGGQSWHDRFFYLGRGAGPVPGFRGPASLYARRAEADPVIGSGYASTFLGTA